MGAVYYAKGRPSMDVYLHGLRLVFIVVAIFATARGGLLAVSIAHERGRTEYQRDRPGGSLAAW